MANYCRAVTKSLRGTGILSIIQSVLGWALLGKAAWKQWQGLKASITNTKG
jgi:hypothetical protein